MFSLCIFIKEDKTMFKKFLCFALVAGMVISLSACSTTPGGVIYTDVTLDGGGNTLDPNATPDPASIVQNPVNPPGMPQSPSDPTTKIDLSKHVSISIGTNTAIDLNKDKLGQAIQDKFNATISVELIPDESIMLRASADTLPDLLRINLTSPAFLSIDKSGMFMHVDPTSLTSYPLLSKVFNDSPEMVGLKTASNDQKYPGLPYANYPLIPTNIGYAVANFYRDDWARQAGINTDTNPIKTVDDQAALFKALTKTTGGIRYGYGGFTWQFHYIPWVDTYSWVKQTTGTYAGKFVPGFMSEQLRPALEYWNNLYKAGYLDPNALNGTAKAWDLFSAEKLGSAYSNSDEYWISTNFSTFDSIQLGNNASFYTSLKSLYGKIPTAEDVLKEIPPLQLNASTPAKWCARPPETGTTGISSKVASDPTKLARILTLYEWLYSPDGLDFMSYGFKGNGLDWQLNSKGQAVRTLPPSKTISGAQMKIYELYPSTQLRSIAGVALGQNTPEATSVYPSWITNHVVAHQVEKNADTSPLTTQINLLRSPQYDTADGTTLMNATWFEGELNKVVAASDFAPAWQGFLDKCNNTYKAGILIDQINEQITAKGLG
jgi:hypothetical protein